ncbi:Uncharacterized protein E6O75_ATG09627 [Venturia nashicola]|uniref:Uncharacterized protein n=1 Tax=Venturia nashicola TaxID=86259 RepID=A0A4Z1NQ99_9PEZI|nr:Uncharacterized protein E6O75_ATG09627 [Venturia nashicola]
MQEDGGWRMEDGGWRMEDGCKRMEDGCKRMEDGCRRMEDGCRRMEDGGWVELGEGQRGVVCLVCLVQGAGGVSGCTRTGRGDAVAARDRFGLGHAAEVDGSTGGWWPGTGTGTGTAVDGLALALALALQLMALALAPRLMALAMALALALRPFVTFAANLDDGQTEPGAVGERAQASTRPTSATIKRAYAWQRDIHSIPDRPCAFDSPTAGFNRISQYWRPWIDLAAMD